LFLIGVSRFRGIWNGRRLCHVLLQQTHPGSTFDRVDEIRRGSV
jgi:hypothetical protein